MIEFIGDLTEKGIPRLAQRAAGVIADKGECAIFLSLETRRAYALTRTDPDWRTAVPRNRAHLVGVYRPTTGVYQLAQWIGADMLAHQRQEATA